MDDMEKLMEEAAQVIEFKPVVCGSRLRAPRAPYLHTCQACGHRRPLFCYRGNVKADRAHTLCFECYRAMVNRTRAGLVLPAHVRLSPSALPAPAHTRGDRDTFYAELQTRRRRAMQAARHALDGLTVLPAAEVPATEALQRVS